MPPIPGPTVDGGVCELGTIRLWVRVEQIGRTSCAASHVEGLRIAGIDAEPAENGLRIHADYCPDADADCRCDLVVSNVGVDVVTGLGIVGVRATLDVSDSHLSVHGLDGRCDCPSCGCDTSAFFYAADASPDDAPDRPARTVFSSGAVVCASATRCGSIDVHYLDVGVDDVGQPVREGDTVMLDGVSIRSIRAPYTTCDCPGCRPGASAAWAAWTRPLRGG